MTLRSLLVLVSTLASVAPARAQSASTQAEVMFRKGRDLMRAGKYGEACNAFETSQNLEPAVTTLLNIADCREKLGQLATALARFSSAEKLARAAGDDKTKALAKVASSHIEKLEPRISKLEIAVSQAHRIAGLAVTRNGEPVPEAAWGISLPVDGATYRIAANAPGREEFEQIVTIKPEGDAVTVEIPALAERGKAPPKIAEPVAQPPPAERPAAEPPPSAHSITVPLAIGGGAVVLLGGALAFELWGDSTYNDAQTDPNPARQVDLWHSANTKRYVAEGMLGASLVAGGAALYLWLHERRVIAPVVAPGQVGMVFEGAW